MERTSLGRPHRRYPALFPEGHYFMQLSPAGNRVMLNSLNSHMIRAREMHESVLTIQVEKKEKGKKDMRETE